MLSQTVASIGKSIPQIEFPETIQSRFGEITIDISRSINFPRGLLGMPDKMNFVLTDFSSQKMEQFKLLQSLDELQLSFITLPIAIENPIIAMADIRGATSDLQIKDEELDVAYCISTPQS